MLLHDFNTDLRCAEQNSTEGFWEVLYRRYFPDFESMSDNITNLAKQYAGIDRVITLKGGAQVFIDEKVQKESWPAFFLEKWSSFADRTPGWVNKPLHCDYIAYAFMPTRTCHLIPFQQLRRAWEEHGHEWAAQYRERQVKSRKNGRICTTVGVPVPIPVVLQACTDALEATWDGPEYEPERELETPPIDPNCVEALKELARCTDWRVGLRCGITGVQCKQCKGVPCRDSMPW